MASGTSKCNSVARCVNKLKQFRAEATRYVEFEHLYRATVDIATMKMWLGDVT